MNYVQSVLEEHLKELIEKDKRIQNMIHVHESELKRITNNHYKNQQKIKAINEKIEYIKNNPSN